MKPSSGYAPCVKCGSFDINPGQPEDQSNLKGKFRLRSEDSYVWLEVFTCIDPDTDDWGWTIAPDNSIDLYLETLEKRP